MYARLTTCSLARGTLEGENTSSSSSAPPLIASHKCQGPEAAEVPAAGQDWGDAGDRSKDDAIMRFSNPNPSVNTLPNTHAQASLRIHAEGPKLTH
jgi:hypothetical protein